MLATWNGLFLFSSGLVNFSARCQKCNVTETQACSHRLPVPRESPYAHSHDQWAHRRQSSPLCNDQAGDSLPDKTELCSFFASSTLSSWTIKFDIDCLTSLLPDPHGSFTNAGSKSLCCKLSLPGLHRSVNADIGTSTITGASPSPLLDPEN